MADFQTRLKVPSSFVVDGVVYANTLLETRRQRAVADLYRLHRDELQKQQGGCMVLVFPTDYTKELKKFSEEDHHVRRCIDVLIKNGLNPMDMFFQGLVRQFSEHSTDDDDETIEAELKEIDNLRDDFEATLLPHLERCINQATLNFIRYGFTPLGYKTLDDSGRVVPYVPLEFVVVRLQPSGKYLCRGIDQQTDTGPFELFFFRHLTDEECPNSDLSMLLPLHKKLKRLRHAHDRSLVIASRPYIVTSQMPGRKESDDVIEEEKIERNRAKLRERMLRDQVNQGTSTAMRLAELAAVMTTEGNAFGGAEELSGSGFLASTVRRTHQEMADKLYRLKTRYNHDRQRLKEKNEALEELLQMYASGRGSETVDLPVRYQLPEGSNHVGSHLNVRPNALNYDMFERLYQVEVTRTILGVQYSKGVTDVGTRQGLARSLVAAVDPTEEDSVPVKSVVLQRFIVHQVLSTWLSREQLPMAPMHPIQQSMGLSNFHLMDRILRKGRMKLWLMCNTGHRAVDITMKYRDTDPYRTGQAVIVPQPVVPVATAQGVPTDSEHDGSEDSDDEYESCSSRQNKRWRL